MPKSKKSDIEKPGKAKKAEKPAKEKKVDSKKKPVAKPAVPPAKPLAKAALEKPKKAAAPVREISVEDISLRAYFIAERRQAMGWPGDSTSDWIEAERQLKAEASRKAKR